MGIIYDGKMGETGNLALPLSIAFKRYVTFKSQLLNHVRLLTAGAAATSLVREDEELQFL